MIKKWCALAMALLLTVSLAACGAGDVGGESMVSSEAQAEESVASMAEADAADSLDGLCEYLKGNGMISGDPLEMQAELIGAEKGAKYVFGYEGNNNVIVELYEFKTSGLSSEAQAVVDSVKKDGTFAIMGQTVQGAVLSGSGKYLMIYKDSSTGEKNVAQKEKVEKAFKAFKK